MEVIFATVCKKGNCDFIFTLYIYISFSQCDFKTFLKLPLLFMKTSTFILGR